MTKIICRRVEDQTANRSLPREPISAVGLKALIDALKGLDIEFRSAEYLSPDNNNTKES